MDNMPLPKVAIIILNYNGYKDTIECIESIKRINYNNHDIIVVDNNSSDDSVNEIKEWCQNKRINLIEKNYSDFASENKYVGESNNGKSLILIKSKENMGYTGGNNLGLKYSLKKSYDYSLILNNDTVVEKDFLNELVSTAENNYNVKLVGSKILSYYNRNIIDSCWQVHDWGRGIKKMGYGEEDIGQYDIEKNVEYIMGCTMLVKNDILGKIGLFNNDYFLYFDDSEFCFRVNQTYNIRFQPNSVIYHKDGSSTGGNESYLTLYYYRRNFLKFTKDNMEIGEYAFVLFYFVISSIIKIFIYKLKGEKNKVKSVITAFVDHLKNNYGKKRFRI